MAIVNQDNRGWSLLTWCSLAAAPRQQKTGWSAKLQQRSSWQSGYPQIIQSWMTIFSIETHGDLELPHFEKPPTKQAAEPGINRKNNITIYHRARWLLCAGWSLLACWKGLYTAISPALSHHWISSIPKHVQSWIFSGLRCYIPSFMDIHSKTLANYPPVN